jgi:hypothetical protein
MIRNSGGEASDNQKEENAELSHKIDDVGVSHQ